MIYNSWKKKYQIVKNNRKEILWFGKFMVNKSHTHLKRRIGFYCYNYLRRNYSFRRFIFSNQYQRLPLAVKMVPRNNAKIWNRIFRETFFNENSKFQQNDNKLNYELDKIDLSKVPTRYLPLVIFMTDKNLRFVFNHIDFDFKTCYYDRFINRKNYRRIYIGPYDPIRNNKKTFSLVKKYIDVRLKKEKIKMEKILEHKKKHSYKSKINVRLPYLKRPRQSDYGHKLSVLRKLKFFYGLIPYNQLYKLHKLSLKSYENRGSISHFLILLESRLDILLYRTNFFDTIFYVKFLIKKGYILVNGKILTYCNCILNKNDIISFSDIYKNKLKQSILSNLNLRLACNYFLPHLEFNFRTMKLFFIRTSLKSHLLYFPFINLKKRKYKENYRNVLDANKKSSRYFKRKNSRQQPVHFSYGFPYKEHGVILREILVEKISF